MVNVDKILEAVGWGLLIALTIPLAAFLTALYAGAILMNLITTHIKQTWRDSVKKN